VCRGLGDSSEDGCEVRIGSCLICGCKMKKFYMGKDYVLLSYACVLDEYYFDFQGLSYKALKSFAVGHAAASS